MTFPGRIRLHDKNPTGIFLPLKSGVKIIKFEIFE